MALKPLNSVGGFSVGEIPQTIVDSNGNVTANYATFSGNLLISNATPGWGIKTDNLYYSNGTPWDLQEAAGSNTQVQFNDNNNFGASANFTFDTSTSLLTVVGNAQFNNANLGNLATANYVNVSSNLVTGNATVNAELSGNTANFSGNVTVNNLTTNLSFSGNTANFSGNVTTNNLSVNLELSGNTANFSGNIAALNANLGNLVQANYVNAAVDVNVTGNVSANNANIGSGNIDLYANGEIAASTANFSGNVYAAMFVGNVQANITITAPNTAVLYSNGGLVEGSNNFTFDFANNHLIANGTANITGNTSVGAILTDNYYYANGQPVDFQQPAGSNTQIQYNDNGDFGASANFVWDQGTNTLSVFGNANVTTLNTSNIASTTDVNVSANGFVSSFYGANGLVSLPADLTANGNITSNANLTVTNANLGNLATANYINVASNLVTSNATVNLELSGNTANFSGNVIVPNLTVNTALSGNTANFSGNVVVPNLTVNLELAGNTANFSGNVTTNNLGVNLELAGNTANFTSNVTVNNLTVNVNLEGNTANFSGNITALNANLGNIVDANYIRTQEVYNGNTKIFLEPNANIVLASTGSNVVTINNLGANFVGYIQANGEVAAGSVLTGNVTSNIGNLTLYSQQSGDTYIQLRPSGNGTIDAGNARIQDLAEPINSQDAATKFYVDTVAEGLHVHASAEAATPNTLAVLSGGVVTYNNGTAGVGATLTTTGSYTTIDGVNVATVGTRILVKNEANAAHNGIYVYTSSTVLTRATDYNSAAEIQAGDFLFVNSGTIYNNTGWVQVDTVTTVGTDPIVFEQFSGVGQYSGANGISIVGTLITANVDNNTTEISGGNIIVKAGANLTTPNIGAATGTSLDLTGNIIAANINANAALTSNTANITTIANIGNVVISNDLLTNNANINLALNGNTANFSGNVTVNNLTTNLELAGNTANFSGNITALNANLGNLATANYVNIAANLHTVNANVTGTLEVANANISSNLTVNNLTVNLELAGNTANFSGNVVLPNLTVNLALLGNTANFTGNLESANYYTAGLANVGNLNVTANVTSDLLPSANLTYDLGANAQRWDNVYAGNVNISGSIVAVANIEGNVTTSNVFVANTAIDLGNTSIYWGETTTTSIAANQTISSVPFSGVTGVEWLVKGVDSTGAKYSMAMVTAVTDGANADFSTFGTVNLGGTTGTLAVNIVGSNITLQVTPSSSNSTVWVTQYRTI